MIYVKELVEEYFYDGHGEGELGGRSIAYRELNEENKNDKEWFEIALHFNGKTIVESWSNSKDVFNGYREVTDEYEEDLYAQDGYNCTREYTTISIIGKKEYEIGKLVTSAYNKLLYKEVERLHNK